jgi:hypothetical protein
MVAAMEMGGKCNAQISAGTFDLDNITVSGAAAWGRYKV